MKSIQLIVILFFALSCKSAFAAKACNELKSTQCKGRDDCSWVKKSTRKDGTTTKAYCRKKPGKKSDQKASKKPTKKTDKKSKKKKTSKKAGKKKSAKKNKKKK